MTLTAAAKMLAGAGIVRTHRSALCRRDAVVALARSRYGALQTRMQSGALIPVGRNHRHAVMALMKSRSDVPGCRSSRRLSVCRDRLGLPPASRQPSVLSRFFLPTTHLSPPAPPLY